MLGSLGPITKDLDAINRKVAERKDNLRSLITNFNELTKEVGKSEQALDRPGRDLERGDRRDRRAGPERPARRSSCCRAPSSSRRSR